MKLGPGYRRRIWVVLFLLNTNIRCYSNSLLYALSGHSTYASYAYKSGIWLELFILYRDIFLEPLTYKRGKKLRKSHISFSPSWNSVWDLIWITNFKKLHAVSTWCYTKALPLLLVGHLRCHGNDWDFTGATMHLLSRKIRLLFMTIII